MNGPLFAFLLAAALQLAPSVFYRLLQFDVASLTLLTAVLLLFGFAAIEWRDRVRDRRHRLRLA